MTGSLYKYAMMMASMGMMFDMPFNDGLRSGNTRQRSSNLLTASQVTELKRVADKRMVEIKKQRGMKEWSQDGFTVWAINRKNADRKLLKVKKAFEENVNPFKVGDIAFISGEPVQVLHLDGKNVFYDKLWGDFERYFASYTSLELMNLQEWSERFADQVDAILAESGATRELDFDSELAYERLYNQYLNGILKMED